jgi:O-antigen/teichoic acid export membrane protein
MTLGSSFSGLLFQPNFAKAKPEERLALMAKGLATITLICAPPVIVLVLFGAIAVPLVFGEQWAPASPVVALLAVSGLLRALTGVGGALYTVTGRNGRLLNLSLAAAVATVAIMVGLAPFGVVWVSAAVALRSLAQLFAIFMFLHETSSRLGHLFWRNCVWPMLASACGAALIGWGLIELVGASAKAAQLLVLASAGLAAVLISFVMLRDRI